METGDDTEGTPKDACEKGVMEKSAVVEQVWENNHPIHWEKTTVLDHGKGQLGAGH